MTLLAIGQAAADIIGIPRPSSIIGQNDTSTRLLYSCANRVGREMARRAPWQALTSTSTFVSVSTQAQPGSFPADFARIVPGSLFNVSRHRACFGPLSPQEWSAGNNLTNQPFVDAFVIRDGQIYLLSPNAGDTYSFEYVRNVWCSNAAGTTFHTSWSADDDVPLLDEELHILGLIWTFKKARGLEYAEDFASYERNLTTAMSADAARRTITLGPGRLPQAPTVPIVSEGSWSL